MIKNFYAIISGMHFALLQFGYILLLQMSFSSTYLSYMIISLAWIGGTLLGLWWKNLNPVCALVIGIVCYGFVYTASIRYPFMDSILFWSGLGVSLSGLWAGRFFVVLQPIFAKSDQLFFMENNGFILGIVATFLGFSLLGSPFLLWAPFTTTSLLLMQHKWLMAQCANTDTVCL